VVGATKWCVFKRILPSRTVVLAAVQERMERMGTTSVDLLQASLNLELDLQRMCSFTRVVSLAGLFGPELFDCPAYPSGLENRRTHLRDRTLQFRCD